MLLQNITSDVLIEKSYSLFTGFSDESGLGASQVTQMTPNRQGQHRGH